MKFNLYRILKIVLVIMMVVTISFSFIISSDNNHIDTCHEEHCIKCAIIHIAKSIVHTIITLKYVIVKFLLIQYVMAKCHYTFFKTDDSLVYKMVQFNE